jgi:hypothetical protein
LPEIAEAELDEARAVIDQQGQERVDARTHVRAALRAAMDVGFVPIHFEFVAKIYLGLDHHWTVKRFVAYRALLDLVREEAIIAGIESEHGYPCDDILSFIEVRLAEETLLARRCEDPGDDLAARRVGLADEARRVETPQAELAARFDTARVLRAIEAKREIIRSHVIGHDADCPTCIDYWHYEDEDDRDGHPVPVVGTCPTLRALASEWSDHPDFRREW